jgi:recombination protein RecA
MVRNHRYKGAWFSMGEEKIGQGGDKTGAYLEVQGEFAPLIEQKLRKVLFPGDLNK